MTPQELKASILQLAIQGKLVEQRPEEGTGEELYRQIQSEKQRLIKSGKIKKEKPLPEITPDEIPFDIPESWTWCRVTDCGVFIAGYTPKPTDLSKSGMIPYFKVANMNYPGNELFLTHTDSYINNPSLKSFLKGTIVYPKNGGAVFTNKKRILAQDSVVDLNTGGYYPIAPLDVKFAYIFISNIDFRKCYKGTALPTIDMDKLKSKLFPLPPLAEQRRIVAKIEELLPYIDRYEKAWSKLEDFNKRFPGDMQKSLLQMAIQGKLVDQRPEEGTGEELLEKILATKNTKGTKKNPRAETRIPQPKAVREADALAGVRRRGKTDAASPREDIPDDEKPFDIPESWVWVRLGEVVFNHGQKKPTGDFSYIDIGSIDNKNQRLSDAETIVHPENASPRARKIVQKGDVIYATVRPYLHNVCVIDREFSREPIASTGFAVMACGDCLDNKYLFYFLLSPDFDRYANSSENAKGVAYPAISDMRLYNALIPLPPLAEQKRIVAKLEELLPLCDRLK